MGSTLLEIRSNVGLFLHHTMQDIEKFIAQLG